MKKLAFVCAAVLAIAAPSVVSAQGISVHVGDDGYRHRNHYREHYREYGRPEYRVHDHGWHRGWQDRRWEHRGDNVTVIKRHRHEY